MIKQIYELKIDNELRDLLPPLTKDEYEQLEKNIISDGCTIPLFTWNGYIADGHNRYSICQKHKIPFEIIKLAYQTKEEVMHWMIDSQLGRRNLTPIQRIAVAKKYEEKLKEKAKGNQKIAAENTNNKKDGYVHMDNSDQIQETKVRQEIAKLANVGSGTLARYDVVMKSDDENIKNKMLSDEISISKAYEEVSKLKHRESPVPNFKPVPTLISKIETQKTIAEKKCFKCKHTKPIDEFSDNEDFCNECMKNINAPIGYTDVTDDGSEVAQIIKDLKTPKVAADFIVPSNELLSIKNMLSDSIQNANERIFERYNLPSKMSEKDKDDAIFYLNQVQGELIKLKNKIEKINLKGEKN